MDDSRILVDTSVIIDYLRKQNRQNSILFQAATTYALHMSSVTEYELFAGALNEDKRRDLLNVLPFFTVIALTSSEARQAAQIYRTLRSNNQLIEIRDILIAATALTFDLPLLTLNEKHFNRIAGLTLLSLPLTERIDPLNDEQS